MLPTTTQPDIPFRLMISPKGTTIVTGIKITGLINGVSKSENVTCTAEEVSYSKNFYDSITYLGSRSYFLGSTINITAIDDAYQPIYWRATSDPYPCVFSTINGLSAQIMPDPYGLLTNVGHYVRAPIKAPVYKNMEVLISPGYENEVWVPVSDFDKICLPISNIPIEWAFRVMSKADVQT